MMTLIMHLVCICVVCVVCGMCGMWYVWYVWYGGMCVYVCGICVYDSVSE